MRLGTVGDRRKTEEAEEGRVKLDNSGGGRRMTKAFGESRKRQGEGRRRPDKVEECWRRLERWRRQQKYDETGRRTEETG